MDLIYRMRAEFERSDHPQKSIEELRRVVAGVAEDGPAREGILFSASFWQLWPTTQIHRGFHC